MLLQRGKRPREYATDIYNGDLTLDDCPEEFRGLVQDHVKSIALRKATYIAGLKTKFDRQGQLREIPEHLRPMVKNMVIDLFNKRKARRIP